MDALARGMRPRKNRLIARFQPAMHLKFEASTGSEELVATAEEETFRRVFRFLTAGHQSPDEASLLSWVENISGYVMGEIRRAHGGV